MACLRAKLLEKRQRLLKRMQAELFEAAEPIGVSGDCADMANSTSARETCSEIESAESRAVAQIDHVLRRIACRKYDVCEDCGRRIPKARLRIVPDTFLCVECKQRDERAAKKSEMEAAFESSDLEGLRETDVGDRESQHGTIRGRRVA
jgi:DnaK suppressor protein